MGKKQCGTLYGVGVGPGDPELITLKAARILRECDWVAAPDTGGSTALEIASSHMGDKPVLRLEVPMTRDKAAAAAAHGRGADALCARLEAGEDVALLTLGDPSVYSSYQYLARLVRERGYAVEAVPGVPSFCAAAAALGEPLCEWDRPMQVLPADCPDLAGALDRPGAKVIMKMGRRMGRTLELLGQKGLLERTALVRRCGFDDQLVVPALAGDEPEDAGYFAILLVKE